MDNTWYTFHSIVFFNVGIENKILSQPASKNLHWPAALTSYFYFIFFKNRGGMQNKFVFVSEWAE